MISTYTATKQRIWDRDDVPVSLLDAEKSLLPMLSYNTGSRLVNSQLGDFFRYLPLYNNGLYTTGLTIYIALGIGIIGLEAHFNKNTLSSGCCDGI
jgi:hypothetical protein